jgi:hypothetical protein
VALGSLDDSSGAPAVQIDDAGIRTVSWPAGRPDEVVVTVDLFEWIVAELNRGRQVLNVLVRVVEAIGALGSTPDNATGAPTPQVDTP